MNRDPKSRDFNYRFSPRSLGLGTRAFVIATGCDVDVRDLSNNTPEIHNRTLNIKTFPSGEIGGTDTDGREYRVSDPIPLVCYKGLPTSLILTANCHAINNNPSRSAAQVY